MDNDLKIVTNPDGSIDISETDLYGKRITLHYAPEAAHAELVRRGARCDMHVEHEKRTKVTPTEFRLVSADEVADLEHGSEPEPNLVAVDTDDLTPATRAEVEAQAGLTGLKEDRAVITEMREEYNTLYERRVLAMSDMTDVASRNDLLDEIDARLTELRDALAIWEAAVAIAELEEQPDHEGDTP
jgi:hypothetical protein